METQDANDPYQIQPSQAPRPNYTPVIQPSEIPASAASTRAVAIMHQQDNENLPLGIAAGFGAALIGAAIWGGVTYATGYQIGWMAIGIGFLVGFAVRLGGRGVTTKFGVIGAAFSLFGCALGNLLFICGLLANQADAPFLNVFMTVLTAPNLAMLLMQETFDVMDILFYGIAVYEGFKFSFDHIDA